MAEDDDTPWAEKHWLEKIWIILWSIVGGFIGLALVAAVMAAAINETRWTFTKVDTERVCTTERHDECLRRTPGIVSSIDDVGFTVAIDRPPYHRSVTSLSDPAPPLGTRVITEDWHGRLVSVVDPVHGRRHTNQWPLPRKDALEALAAWTALLFLPVLVAVGWIAERRKRIRVPAMSGRSLIEEGPQLR